MKIVFTRRNDSLDAVDGISAGLFALAHALVRDGHDVLAVAPRGSAENIAARFHLGVLPEVIDFAPQAWGFVDSIRAWASTGRALVGDLKPDVVVHFGGVMHLRVASYQVGAVHDWSGSIQGPRAESPVRAELAYGYQDMLFPTTSEIAAELRTGPWLTAPPPIGILPNGVVLDGRPSYRPRSQRSRTMVHMGTAPYKNANISIDAFAALATEDDEVSLVVTGPQTAELIRKLETLSTSLRNRVTLPGVLDAEELSAAVGGAAVVVVPSNYSIPVSSPTVLEAIACGTPVVCSSVSADLVGSSGELGGLLTSAFAVDELVEAVTRLLDDEVSWTAASRAAQQTARRFDATTVAQRMLSMLG
jgi:glycosyltransferase involved in cell wall biosynthesis